MNRFQKCTNTADCVPLYLPQQLFLKPIAKANISILLPADIKKTGKPISHLEVMTKIKELIQPEEFTSLKVSKASLDVIRFEGEVELHSRLDKIITRVDNRMIRLKDFTELMRLKASEAKSDFPTRRAWDAYFSEHRDEMDEMKPGERPDTIHLTNLPVSWFVPNYLTDNEDALPSEKILHKIFSKFGHIRHVDIPICDPYRRRMKDHISGFTNTSPHNKILFEGYVQFKDYIGFTKAMDALRNMKLVRKMDDGDAFEAVIQVDFDKTKHLSEANMKRREIVRERMVKKAMEKEEQERRVLEEQRRLEEDEKKKEDDLKAAKEQRRRLREEKRKVKILKQLECSGLDEINDKIAHEERKVLKLQRKLEAIRLVEALFARLKEKNEDTREYDNSELRKFKKNSEQDVLTQRASLHNAIRGRVILKSILTGDKKKHHSSSSSSAVSSSDEEQENHKNNDKQMVHPASILANELSLHPNIQNMDYYYDPRWMNFPGYGKPNLYRNFDGDFKRFPAGPSRGFAPRRRRGNFLNNRGGRGRFYPPDVMEEYRRYFSKFLPDHDRRDSRSRSSSIDSRKRNSRKNDRSRRSYSHSKSRSRSRSKSRYSRRRSSRSRRSHSRSRRSWSRRRSKSSDSRSRSRSKSGRRSTDKDKKRRSRTRTPSKTPPKRNDRSASKSRGRSKSWSSDFGPGKDNTKNIDDPEDSTSRN